MTDRIKRDFRQRFTYSSFLFYFRLPSFFLVIASILFHQIVNRFEQLMIMSTHEKLAHRLSCFLFLLLAIQVTQSLAAFTDVPRKFSVNNSSFLFSSASFLAPPVRPERFNSREELKRYLQLVNYFPLFLIKHKTKKTCFHLGSWILCNHRSTTFRSFALWTSIIRW